MADKITPLGSDTDTSSGDHTFTLQSPQSAKDYSTSASHRENVSAHQHQQDQVLPGGERRETITSLELKETMSGSTSTRVRRTRQRLGLHPTAPIFEEHDNDDHAHLAVSKIRGALKEPLAEFFGVMIMIVFGVGSVAQVTLGNGDSGDYQSISWCWGIGVMLGIYVAGDSGAYLNPAILLTSCILRKLPFRRFPVYLVAQVLGGFVGAAIVYANFINAIDAFEGYGIRTVPPAANGTAGIFCTYPKPYLTKASQFFSEFIASAVLMFVIFALQDGNSNKGAFFANPEFFPLALFFLIFGLGAAFGLNTGYAMNLARDFGPRLLTYCVGYGHEVWSAGGYYFWIPMVAPFLGTLFGGALYDLFIYTGPSPINTPWFGFKRLLKPREALEKRLEAQRRDGLV